jgi:NAD(P)-dependent dehydrogenase (short-subunit alcohol dehydrogenase family)
VWSNGEDLERVYVNNWRQTRPRLHNYLIFETVSVSEEIIVGKLVGKTAVIRGGSSGIGLSTAELFVSEGAHVYITGRRQKQLDVATAKIKYNVTGVQGDVSQVEDLDRLYKRITEEKGHIDIVFANAGVGNPSAPIGQTTEEQFHAIFDVNVAGTLFTVQKALPLMRDGGSIVLNASLASIKGLPTFGLYSASKAAIRSFARTWTAELKERSIRVNVLSAGHIDTPIFETGNRTKEQIAA